MNMQYAHTQNIGNCYIGAAAIWKQHTKGAKGKDKKRKKESDKKRSKQSQLIANLKTNDGCHIQTHWIRCEIEVLHGELDLDVKPNTNAILLSFMFFSHVSSF